MKLTPAETSIDAAIKGIEDKFGVTLNKEEGKEKLSKEKATYDKIIEILSDIHDKWVKENAKKWNRGNDEKSKKNLFQHLPLELIGIDEVAKDLMFLAPFLKTLGIETGEMTLEYGAFVPNKEIKEAYARKVEKYKKDNNIEFLEDVEVNIKKVVNNYEPLSVKIDDNQERLHRVLYMIDNIKSLAKSVEAKNDQFGKLPEERENN